jgi:aminoglycoside 2''-phosphotransferase
VDVDTARDELAKVDLSPARIEPILGGWASWTFELDGELVVRFPRDADIVEAMHREMRLLPALAEHVSFRVPVPLYVTEDWFVYEKIPGRGLMPGDDVDAALAMIDELHTFPIDEAARLLGRPAREQHFAEEWSIFSAEALVHLDDELRSRVAVLREPTEVERLTLIHNDLGPEHVIVDDAGRPVGIIDFEDAIVGDPDVDRMPLHVVVGRPLTEQMWRSHCRGTLHAIVHHVREGEHHEVPQAVAELRRRLDSRPER